jgi:hypothetical protein
MNKDTKKKYLDYLATSKIYTESLEKIPDENEKKKIKAFAEEFYLNFVEGLVTMKKAIEDNPEKLAEVMGKRIPKEEAK